jgi:7-carboxy-7-deazaguanine synthase
MDKIKVSEIFYSLQGEGKYVGVPSVFLRTFGCNFTCSGFGMPRGSLSEERLAVDPTKYNNYKDLPLVHTGCDSYASWDVRFKKLSPVMDVKQIVDKFEELLPDGRFSWDKHLIITGGEPLLGWQRSFPALFDEIRRRGMNLKEITFETNGTQMLDKELVSHIAQYATTFSVSAKLPCSGEKWEDAIKPDVVAEYMKWGDIYLKLVVATEEDVKDAVRAAKEYNAAGVDVPVYLMPVGGTTETYSKFERQVADFCRDNGFRFSPRIQVPLYKNAWGT